MKKQILIIVLLGEVLFASAQKNTWTIGLYTGVQGQLVSSYEQSYVRPEYDFVMRKDTLIDTWFSPQMGQKHVFSYIPPIELTVKYNIRDYFSIASGIGYRSYFMKLNDAIHYTFRTDYIQIPIIFQYDVPFKKKGFSFFMQWGIALESDIYSKESGHLIEYPEPFIDRIMKGSSFTDISTNTYIGGGIVDFLLHTGSVFPIGLIQVLVFLYWADIT